MIILFMNPEGEQGNGATTNAAVFAMEMAKEKNTVLLSMENGKNAPGQYLTGRMKKAENVSGYKGIEALRKLVYADIAERDAIYECAYALMEKLFLLDANLPENDMRMERDYKDVIEKILKCLERCFEVVIADIGKAKGACKRRLIDAADVIVQNEMQAGDRMAFKENAWKAPVFHLLSRYDAQSKYNLHNLRRIVAELNQNNSGIMPYSTEIMDACRDGKLLRVYGQTGQERRLGAMCEYHNAVKQFVNAICKITEGGNKASYN